MKRGSYIGCGRHIKSTHWFGCVYSFFVCVVWLWCGKLCNNVRAAQLIKGTQSCFSTGADECTFQFQHLFRTRYKLFTIRLRSYELKHNHDRICNVFNKATFMKFWHQIFRFSFYFIEPYTIKTILSMLIFSRVIVSRRCWLSITFLPLGLRVYQHVPR